MLEQEGSRDEINCETESVKAGLDKYHKSMEEWRSKTNPIQDFARRAVDVTYLLRDTMRAMEALTNHLESADVVDNLRVKGISPLGLKRELDGILFEVAYRKKQFDTLMFGE
jgi:hypothetical protein